EIINENTFEEILPEITLIFFGDGAEKCSDVIKRKNRLFISNFSLSASFMHIPAVNALKEGRFENKIYFEPFYLKDFLATKPKRKVI
ncbi:MAG: tRNA (adenosine(37)-N6)-threonylcarbamoyltransferase complex dimerization subunit type 1 TsaB, partial [Bacteroidales bacterium]